MIGRYDDLTQEMWGRADADMPRDYLDAVLAQIATIQSTKPLLVVSEYSEQLKRNEHEEQQFLENYELTSVEFFDGGWTETYRPRKKA